MRIGETLKSVPLGLPMTIASLGTVATLFAGKRLHAGFGAAWAVLSLWHGWQHRGKMQKDALHLAEKIPCHAGTEAPASALERLLASIRVVSFTEGRVRVRSPWFLKNEALRRQIEEYVCSFTGVEKAEINPMTGSLLVEYHPGKLREKPGLKRLEERLEQMSRHSPAV